jgi:hypothetical protein
MTGSNLIRLQNGLKTFDVGHTGDFAKFVCYITGKPLDPEVIGTKRSLEGCPIVGGNSP